MQALPCILRLNNKLQEGWSVDALLIQPFGGHKIGRKLSFTKPKIRVGATNLAQFGASNDSLSVVKFHYFLTQPNNTKSIVSGATTLEMKANMGTPLVMVIGTLASVPLHAKTLSSLASLASFQGLESTKQPYLYCRVNLFPGWQFQTLDIMRWVHSCCCLLAPSAQ